MEEREYRAALARLAENEAKIAYLRGKMEATLETFRSDPEILDLAAKTSAQTGKSVEDLMDHAFGRYLPTQTTQPEPPVDGDPLVTRFRSLVGEG